jgi:hypothetical protein
MLTIFCGFDSREEVGTHIFTSSVLARASIPVAFVPLNYQNVQIGTNQFTATRFLVPYLMGYKGRAVFADAADMICLVDAKEIQAQLDKTEGAVAVVKHNYKTKNKIKYIGTPMESPNLDYPRKNWSSLMMINCEHPAWRSVTPESINTWKMLDLLQFAFLTDPEIESIPDAWNRLIDESQPIEGAKILHWTAGIPGFKHYANAPSADLWRQEWQRTAHPLLT